MHTVYSDIPWAEKSKFLILREKFQRDHDAKISHHNKIVMFATGFIPAEVMLHYVKKEYLKAAE